ncbi:hypothetical protein D3C75_1196530 [compost metagenome]
MGRRRQIELPLPSSPMASGRYRSVLGGAVVYPLENPSIELCQRNGFADGVEAHLSLVTGQTT